ncbi:unnamed protein product [Staurois parvus]|uniref:Uncharacterized protein n=1 Tax=Staurois parvus TaxID=386267 RepID=A0ABN9DQ21_9NEOB|nr:unnamed protein product [Staurois parvus]
MGPRTDSSCCCQARNLSWAPVPPPHAAAARSRVSSLVPVRPPIAAVSIATLCHVPLSGLLTLLVGFPFCHRVLLWPPIAAASTATLLAPHSGFGPVTAQMSEVCVILRSTALICMSY